jgi:acyl-CoA synthetase (NDP forming)
MLLDAAELTARLAAAGVRQAPQALCPDAAAAVAAAAAMAGPVALKLVSPDLVHKSDVGGVRLGLFEAGQVRAAAADLVALAAGLGLGQWRLLVQQMVPACDVEVFVGLKRDAVFGPMVVVGAGGRLVELLPSVALRTAPVSVDRARAMLLEVPVGRVLAGHRGTASTLDSMAELVSRASTLLERHPDLAEVDLNPVLADGRGAVAVDSRAVIGTAQAQAQAQARVQAQASTHAAPAGPASPDLTPLLEPASILVVGASSSGARLPGNAVLRYLRKFGYQGRVHVVHPTAASIDGYPAVAGLADLAGQRVDLACVGVAAARSLDVLEECGKLGVAAAIVFGSGFSEVGEHAAERRLAAAAARYGMLLCGPNTVGVISPAHGVHACFSQAQEADAALAGTVALVTQSGALGGSLLSQAWPRGIGISRFISVGNQARLSVADYLDYLVADRSTSTVAVLLEGVPDGLRLADSVRRLRTAGKAVCLMKVGRGAAGARAVQSHTGAIAGDYAVFRSVLNEAGAILVDSVTELLDVLALHASGLASVTGARMGVLSTSGGACGMVADLCERYGFVLPQFSRELQGELAEVLPSFAATVNPVDVTGQVITEPALYGRALELVLRSDEVDLVKIMLTTVAGTQATQIATEIAAQVRAAAKPVLVTWTVAPTIAAEAFGVLTAAGLPVFPDPARAIRAAALVRTGTSSGHPNQHVC